MQLEWVNTQHEQTIQIMHCYIIIISYYEQAGKQATEQAGK